MRQLIIDMSELELAFEGGYDMISYYLDLETGEVITVSEEVRGILETIYESYYDEQTQIVDWEMHSKMSAFPIGSAKWYRTRTGWRSALVTR